MSEANEAEPSSHGSAAEALILHAFLTAPDRVRWALDAIDVIFYQLGRDDGLNGTRHAQKVLNRAVEVAEHAEQVCFEWRIRQGEM